MLIDICVYRKRHLKRWFKDILQTITVNLCRNLKYQIDEPITDAFYKDFDYTKINENNWDHLSMIYHLFEKTIAQKRVTVDTITQCINGQTLKDLVQVFHSKYQNERTYLMEIFQKMCRRCWKVKPWVIELIGVFGSYFDDVITNKSSNVHGVSEILWVVWVLIPVLDWNQSKKCNAFILSKCVSLLQCEQLDIFYEAIEQCIAKFISSDANACFDILRALMDYWPLDVNHKNTYRFTHLVLNVIIQINKNVLRKTISMDKIAKSTDLFDLMLGRLCYMQLPRKYNKSLRIFSDPEMKTFIAFAVQEHIPKIVKICENIEKDFAEHSQHMKLLKPIKLRYIEDLKMTYMDMGSKLKLAPLTDVNCIQ